MFMTKPSRTWTRGWTRGSNAEAVDVDAPGLNGCSYPAASRSDRYASSAQAFRDGRRIDSELVADPGAGATVGVRASSAAERVDIGVAESALRAMPRSSGGVARVAAQADGNEILVSSLV